MNRIYGLILAALLLLSVSCSVERNLPEGGYLLDRVVLETDSGFISEANMMELVQQKPNDPKLGLKIYNMVDNDSTWWRRLVRKLGEPPVIFSQRLMSQSLNEMTIEARNRGYFNARVHSSIDTVGRRLSVEYHIHEGAPYRIRNYSISLPTEEMNSIASGVRQARRQSAAGTDSTGIVHRLRNLSGRIFSADRETLIKPGAIFDMRLLEQEMNRVSSRLRNSGYYRLTTDNLHFMADTALRSSEADLTLVMIDSTMAQTCRIGQVSVFSGFDRFGSGRFRTVDSTERNDIKIYYNSRLRFLRPGVIAGKTLVRPGSLYRQRAAESTASLFQAMGCVGNAEVNFVEGRYADSTLLDCEIYLTPADNHSLQAGLNGTNKAGDFGVAADVSYGNRNLFNGSEQFALRIKSAYEFIRNSDANDLAEHNFYEFGITPSLTFPEIHLPFVNSWLKDRYNPQTLYSLGFNIQRRPQFIRNFFNFRWQFRWAGRNNILSHTISLLDVNYVSMPWASDEFKRFLNTRLNPVTRYSYDDVFTFGSAYGLIYSNAGTGKKMQRLYTLRFNIESSGNMLNALFSIEKGNAAGRQFNVFGNPYAQYVKADIDFAETFPLTPTATVAIHAGAGVARPYKNSTIMPFEKRYYAGGPNSVRGWHTRALGPGAMTAADDMALRVGDVNLILSAEYRFKALSWFEPAIFIDGGNIWTISDYADQPGGEFAWNRFYREMAVGAGLGLRFDLQFLVFRVDAGKRLRDPAMPEGERFIAAKRRFWQDWTPYIAIGYPF